MKIFSRFHYVWYLVSGTKSWTEFLSIDTVTVVSFVFVLFSVNVSLFKSL